MAPRGLRFWGLEGPGICLVLVGILGLKKHLYTIYRYIVTGTVGSRKVGTTQPHIGPRVTRWFQS